MSPPVVAPVPPVVRARDAYICVEMDRPNNRYRTLIRLGWAGITLPIPIGDKSPLRRVGPDGNRFSTQEDQALTAAFSSEDWQPFDHGDWLVTFDPKWYAEALRQVPERKRKRPEPVTVEVSV